MREMTDFKEIFLHVFDFLPEEFDVGLEPLHLHGTSLLQSFITFSHQLQTIGHLIRALLKTTKLSLTLKQPPHFNKRFSCQKHLNLMCFEKSTFFFFFL